MPYWTNTFWEIDLFTWDYSCLGADAIMANFILWLPVPAGQ